MVICQICYVESFVERTKEEQNVTSIKKKITQQFREYFSPSLLERYLLLAQFCTPSRMLPINIQVSDDANWPAHIVTGLIPTPQDKLVHNIALWMVESYHNFNRSISFFPFRLILWKYIIKQIRHFNYHIYYLMLALKLLSGLTHC